ncbi:MAG: hypothetical protein AVDCRST_MAG49-1321, partial [uncultured Thermomicrobiales bacterium]
GDSPRREAHDGDPQFAEPAGAGALLRAAARLGDRDRGLRLGHAAEPRRRDWAGLPHRGRVRAAGVAIEARRAADDGPPGGPGRRPRRGVRPRAGVRGDDGRVPAAGGRPRPPRPGRAPVLPVPGRV